MTSGFEPAYHTLTRSDVNEYAACATSVSTEIKAQYTAFCRSEWIERCRHDILAGGWRSAVDQIGQ
jgi:hypothetical protein